MLGQARLFARPCGPGCGQGAKPSKHTLLRKPPSMMKPNIMLDNQCTQAGSFTYRSTTKLVSKPRAGGAAHVPSEKDEITKYAATTLLKPKKSSVLPMEFLGLEIGRKTSTSVCPNAEINGNSVSVSWICQHCLWLLPSPLMFVRKKVCWVPVQVK